MLSAEAAISAIGPFIAHQFGRLAVHAHGPGRQAREAIWKRQTSFKPRMGGRGDGHGCPLLRKGWLQSRGRNKDESGGNKT